MEHMQAAIWIDWEPHEVDFLETTLREAGAMVPGNYKDPGGPRLAEYLLETKLKGVEFRALLDRNLISPLVQLAGGASIPSDPEQARVARLSCAVMAFCIRAEMLVEPAMALYEFASHAGNQEAQDELRLFRIADNADPRHFLDLAMGKIEAIPEAHLSEVAADIGVQSTPVTEADFQKRLNMWRPNYLYVLKSFELMRSGRTPVEAAKALMQWQADEAFYNAAASIYCLAAMSHKPPRGGMLKGIGTHSARKIRDGARNATWDICMLQQFGRYVTTESGASWSLWSDDFALREMARSLFVRDHESESEAMGRFYDKTWGKDGPQLKRTYEQMLEGAGIGTPERIAKTRAAVARIDDDIREAEMRLGIWRE